MCYTQKLFLCDTNFSNDLIYSGIQQRLSPSKIQNGNKGEQICKGTDNRGRDTVLNGVNEGCTRTDNIYNILKSTDGQAYRQAGSARLVVHHRRCGSIPHHGTHDSISLIIVIFASFTQHFSISRIN